MALVAPFEACLPFSPSPTVSPSEIVLPSSVVAPFETPPEAPCYCGLLEEGHSWGRAIMGNTTAWTFRGSEAFAQRSHTLLASFGWHGCGHRELTLHRGFRPNTWYVILKADVVFAALRRFLYGQLCQRKAIRASVVLGHDEEAGEDITETIYLNEEDLMQEAARLAMSFLAYEVESDYSTVDDPYKDSRRVSVEEYSTELLDQMTRATHLPDEDDTDA